MMAFSEFARSHRATEEEVQLNRITELVIGAGLEIHRELGPGLPVSWKGEVLDAAFRADLIVEGKVIVELKSIERTLPVHKKQVLTYMKLTGIKVGLLLNFGAALFRDGVERLVWGEFQ